MELSTGQHQVPGRVGLDDVARHRWYRSLTNNTAGRTPMTLDLVIRNGTIVDGSGMGRYRADVGVADGRIVEIGRIRAPAQRTINADGLIVAPGFIDGHTHMDAQVNWDRQGTCSCWHGVTSVIMGNCGFALAPC